MPRRIKSGESRGEERKRGGRATAAGWQMKLPRSAGDSGRQAHTGRPGLKPPGGKRGDRYPQMKAGMRSGGGTHRNGNGREGTGSGGGDRMQVEGPSWVSGRDPCGRERAKVTPLYLGRENNFKVGWFRCDVNPRPKEKSGSA